MSILNKLLEIDPKKLTERPTKEYEVKRLSKAFGEPFILTLQTISPEDYAEIQENAVKITKGRVSGVNTYSMQVDTLKEGIKEPSMKNKDLMKHFDVRTPDDLIGKLFLSAEISEIAEEISKLNGYRGQDEVDADVKN